MIPLMRAVTYAALFVSLVLVFVPTQLLEFTGLVQPPTVGLPQAIAATAVVIGGTLALWCVLVFALMGRGTPAPFDPPRRLIVRGPYQFVRNPMYIGAGLAVAGLSLFYESLALLGYTVLFFLATHLFVVWYEEPILRRTFGTDYEVYCQRVRRWRPSRRGQKLKQKGEC